MPVLPPDFTVVLITGATSGIGFDTAARLASDTRFKYHVVLAARNLQKGEAALASIRAQADPTPLSLVHLDVTDVDSINAAAAKLATELGRLDVLVNNAGIAKLPGPGSLHADLRDSFTTNAIGPALVTDAFVPLLKNSGDPRIIYVSSSQGSISRLFDPTLNSSPVGLTYRMSKAALNMLAVYHHREFAPWHCKVWAMCPGYVVTNLIGEANREARRRNGALSSETSAETISSIIEGARDADVGKFVHKDGTYEW